MVGMNWYSTTHYRTRNTIKKHFHERVGKDLPDGVKIASPVKTHYRLFYKNKRSDAPNIVAVIEKFLMDALQEFKVIEEDNVQHYTHSSWEVVEQDRDNPRIEVHISTIKDDNCK